MQKKKFNIKEMIISYKNMLNEWKLHYIYIITLQCNFKSYIIHQNWPRIFNNDNLISQYLKLSGFFIWLVIFLFSSRSNKAIHPIIKRFEKEYFDNDFLISLMYNDVL